MPSAAPICSFQSLDRVTHRKLVRFRRAPHLVAYWRRGTLLLKNYATGQVAAADPLVCRVLDYCTTWRSAAAIGRALGADDSPALPKLLQALVLRSFMHRSDAPSDPRDVAMASLDAWNPVAGFFHTSTKDVHFWTPREARRQARMRAALMPIPPAVSRYRGAPRTNLPVPAGDDVFTRTLRRRRTWRRFSTEPITVAQLATVLGLACGVQTWVGVPGARMPLKTSPSGGARHPVECYVVVRHVTGIRPGIYHYAADVHALERLRGPVPASRIREYLPQSGYFADASVLLFLTAVFPRQVWRYPYSRAYRAALIETGHVCQTVLLTATWLGLAQFSVMGLADSLIEKDLGVDGIRESVLYAAGLARPPAGTTWAPLKRGTLRARPNRYLAPHK